MTFLASQKIIDAFDSAMFQITAMSVILLIGIMIAMVMFVVKYHHKRHPKPARIHGSLKLEILWTVIPTIISFWMFFVGYQGFEIARGMPDPDDEETYVVHVTGRQWAWEFRHEDSGVVDDKLYVPQGRPVLCYLTAPVDDVLHSFFIPHFKVKEDCVPGKINHYWFQGDELGEFIIFCTEFCGNDHAKMYTSLHVVTPEEHSDYLRGKMEERFAPIEKPEYVMTADTAQLQDKVKDVKALYATYCQSCHGAEGQGGLVEGARSFIADPASKWKRGVKITDIFETLTLGLEGTRMNAFDALSGWQRFALAHYVAGFYKDGPDRAQASAEEVQKLIEKYKLDEQKPVVLDFQDYEAKAIEDLAVSPEDK